MLFRILYVSNETRVLERVYSSDLASSAGMNYSAVCSFHIYLYSVKWIETLWAGYIIVNCSVDINILSDRAIRDALCLGCYLYLQ